MQTTLALVAFASVALAQGVTESISPDTPAPAGCAASYSGDFEITAVNSTVVKRDISKRTCGAEGSLTISLADGILKDAQARTGYIASNYQFQFDGPPQAGAIYTAGFSVCGNGSLALGGSTVFYECLSGDFYNLYDRSWAAQCEPILIVALPCGASSVGGVGQITDGQPTGTAVATPVTQISDGQQQGASPIPISQIPDGQPQMPSGLISQISDGQVQNPTGVPGPISQISDGQPQAPTATPISQISDGQPQAPTGTPAPISQISDGQPQAPTATPAPISQISDGQPQAPTGTPAPISQISDGQPQAPTGAPAPITQISDGQPQAPTGAPITQISDGQPQAPTWVIPPISPAPNVTIPATSAPAATTTPLFLNGGNAMTVGSSLTAAVVGLAAMLLL